MKKLLALTLLPASLFAKTVDVEAIGYGKDIRSATKDALVTAVIQTNETSIVTATSTTLKAKTNLEETTLEKSLDNDFQLSSDGKVKSFKILEQSCGANECTVKIVAKVKVKKTDQLDDLNRKLITVNHVSGSFNNAFNTELDAKFVNGGKFAIFAQNYNDEQMDYILDLELVRANTSKRTTDNRKTDPMTGKVTGKIINKYSSVYEVRYKVKSGLSGQVKFMGSQKSTSGRNNLSLLAKITARKVYDDIHDAIFPMRVASVRNDVVTAPKSGKDIKVGDLFEVISFDEPEYDPYTKEVIGHKRTVLGKVEVTTIERKLIRAKIISGAGIAAMNVLEPIVKKAKHNKVVKKTPVKKKIVEPKNSIVDSAGGVIL